MTRSNRISKLRAAEPKLVACTFFVSAEGIHPEGIKQWADTRNVELEFHSTEDVSSTSFLHTAGIGGKGWLITTLIKITTAVVQEMIELSQEYLRRHGEHKPVPAETYQPVSYKPNRHNDQGDRSKGNGPTNVLGSPSPAPRVSGDLLPIDEPNDAPETLPHPPHVSPIVPPCYPRDRRPWAPGPVLPPSDSLRGPDASAPNQASQQAALDRSSSRGPDNDEEAPHTSTSAFTAPNSRIMELPGPGDPPKPKDPEPIIPPPQVPVPKLPPKEPNDGKGDKPPKHKCPGQISTRPRK